MISDYMWATVVGPPLRRKAIGFFTLHSSLSLFTLHFHFSLLFRFMFTVMASIMRA